MVHDKVGTEKPQDESGSIYCNQKVSKCSKNHENMTRGTSVKKQPVAKSKTLSIKINNDHTAFNT